MKASLASDSGREVLKVEHIWNAEEWAEFAPSVDPLDELDALDADQDDNTDTTALTTNSTEKSKDGAPPLNNPRGVDLGTNVGHSNSESTGASLLGTRQRQHWMLQPDSKRAKTTHPFSTIAAKHSFTTPEVDKQEVW